MKLMAILNLTPDSFSDGGIYNNLSSALEFCRNSVINGADIIDIGAESTDPKVNPISIHEEFSRLNSILPNLTQEVSLPFSIDTYKSQIAEYALDNGVSIVNDVSGFQKSSNMLELISRRKPYYICGHIYGSCFHNENHAFSIDDITSYFHNKTQILLDIGLKREKIIIDPGFGFGKSIQDNIDLFRNIDKLKGVGFKICCGVSRKRFIKDISGISPGQILGGSIAATVLLAAKDIDIIRAHDVAETASAIRLVDTIRKNL